MSRELWHYSVSKVTGSWKSTTYSLLLQKINIVHLWNRHWPSLNGLNCTNDGEFFLILYIYINKIKRYWFHVIYHKEMFLLKGRGHQMICFWKSYQMISVLSVHADKVLNFYPALFKRKINMLFEFASFKTLTNSKNWSESLIKILYPHSFPLVGRFSPVYTHGRLSEQL
jgi:hypothetical protein